MDGAQLNWSCTCKEKAGILQNETVWANAAKMPPEALYEMYVKPWHPDWREWGCVFCLKSFQRLRVSVTGLLTGISTQRSATGPILQPLRSLSMLNQTPNRSHVDKLKMFAWDYEDV